MRGRVWRHADPVAVVVAQDRLRLAPSACVLGNLENVCGRQRESPAIEQLVVQAAKSQAIRNDVRASGLNAT